MVLIKFIFVSSPVHRCNVDVARELALMGGDGDGSGGHQPILEGLSRITVHVIKSQVLLFLVMISGSDGLVVYCCVVNVVFIGVVSHRHGQRWLMMMMIVLWGIPLWLLLLLLLMVLWLGRVSHIRQGGGG